MILINNPGAKPRAIENIQSIAPGLNPVFFYLNPNFIATGHGLSKYNMFHPSPEASGLRVVCFFCAS